MVGVGTVFQKEKDVSVHGMKEQETGQDEMSQGSHLGLVAAVGVRGAVEAWSRPADGA